MTDMTVTQAVGELGGLVRSLKAMTKLGEVLSVASEIEKIESELSKRVAILQKQDAALELKLKQDTESLKALKEELSGVGPKAQAIVNEARDTANTIVREASQKATSIITSAQDKEKSMGVYIESLKQELNALTTERNQAEVELASFKASAKKERDRVLAALSGA